MNIAVDIRSLLEAHWSGISWYTYDILNALFKIDQENHYFLFYNQYQTPKFNFAVWNQENVHFAPFRFPNKILNLSLKFFQHPYLDKLTGQRLTNIAPLTDRQIAIFWLPNANFAALSANCPLFLTVHDLSFLRYPQFLNNRERFWHSLVNPKKLCLQAKKIIAVSENTKADLQNLYNISEYKIAVIYHGVDHYIFRPLCDQKILLDIRRKYCLPEKFILFVGSIQGRKNAKLLLSAYHKLSRDDVKLVFVSSNLDKQISRPGGKVMFLSVPDRQELSAIYNLAEMLVYPSFYEGFGLPVLEAMACGCPVIAAAGSSLPEVIAQSGLLVDPYNIAEQSFAMLAVLENQKLRSELVTRGLAQAKKFSWEESGQKMLELFKNF